MPGARALAAAVAALAGAAMLVSASSHDEAAPMPHPFGHKRDDMDVHALRSCLEAGDLSFLGDAETVRSIYEMRSGPYDGDLLQTQAVVTVPDTARSAPILEWLPPIDRGTGVPGRSVSTLETLVNLELGQAIVLGGVIARAEARTRAGLPGLSQIPILGALFGTHSRRFEESEALMFIVPSVVEAVPLQQRNRIQEAIRAYEEYRGGVDEVELLEQPRVQGVRVTTSTEDEDD